MKFQRYPRSRHTRVKYAVGVEQGGELLFRVLIEEAEQSSHNSANGPKRRRAKREYVGQDAASCDELETENPTARYVCKRVKVVRPPVLAYRVPSRSIRRRLIPAAGTAGVI